jgi:hypothetical protein
VLTSVTGAILSDGRFNTTILAHRCRRGRPLHHPLRTDTNGSEKGAEPFVGDLTVQKRKVFESRDSPSTKQTACARVNVRDPLIWELRAGIS